MNLTGQKFKRLTVIRRVGSNKHYKILWLCKCECGQETIVQTGHLKSGHTKSCGCFKRHGHVLNGKRSPTYLSWSHMKSRCLNPRNIGFHLYGGRGITVCDRWLVFDNFLADMGERPEGTSIDRIDVNGNYEPSNCRWATPREQRLNQRV